MIIVGLAFLVSWLFVVLSLLSVDKSLLVTAIVFIVLGILLGERPWERKA